MLVPPIYIYIYICKYKSIFSTQIFDVSLWLTSFFKSYAEKKANGSKQKVSLTWLQFRFWFRPFSTKVPSFIIKKFSCYFSLSFNVSIDIVRMLLSCTMIMNFVWLLKSWSGLFKMFTSWHCIGIFDIFSVVIGPNVE